MNIELVKKRMAGLILSKLQNDEKIKQLDDKATILKQRLHIATE